MSIAVATWHSALVLLMPIVVAPGAAAQSMDSLLLTLPGSKAQATERVLVAMIRSGLVVTRNENGLIESQQDDLGGFLKGKLRVIRILVAAEDSTALVRIIATETDGSNPDWKRLSNKSGGDGRVVWCRMVTVARLLDSAQVAADAAAECPKGPEAPDVEGPLEFSI